MLKVMKMHTKETVMGKRSRKVSQRMIIGVLAIILAGSGLYSYLSRDKNQSKPPVLNVLMNNSIRREAVLGSYEWHSGRKSVIADADHPAMFEYGESSTLEASKGQKVYMSVAQNEGELPHSISSFEVYRKGSSEKLEDAKYSVNGETVVLDIQESSGDYVYMIRMDYGDKGEAHYGLHILVDQQSFSLENLKNLKTPYVGDHGKVGAILKEMPVPGSGYVQQYMGLKTEKEPYGVIVYYEPKEELSGNIIMPGKDPANEIYLNMEKNALVLLSLIDNAGQITFKVRNTPSEGQLEENEYKTSMTFTETELSEKYGSLENILENRELFPEE